MTFHQSKKLTCWKCPSVFPQGVKDTHLMLGNSSLILPAVLAEKMKELHCENGRFSIWR